MRCWRKGAVVAVAMMVGAGSAQADFVIGNGQTVFTTQVLTFNQTGVVEPGGSIFTVGAGIAGVNGNLVRNRGRIATTGGASAGIALVNNNTVLNTGTISTLAGGAFGIVVVNGNTITNGGLIRTLGVGSFGITGADGNSISNSGRITTVGVTAHGVQFIDGNTFRNSGTIRTLGVDAVGVLGNDGNTVKNGGVISTTGVDAFGIVLNNNGVVDNDGTISTFGAGAHGVLVGNGNTIANTGRIMTTGLTAHGVEAGAGNMVINSGFISASGIGSAAVLFNGAGNTLRLQPGSVIVGPLDFAAGNTLVVDNGHSIAHTFTSNPPVVIANGAPFVANGLQVAVVDPTSLALADDVFFDLTNTVTGSVLSRLHGARQGGSPGQAVAALDGEGDPLSFASSLGVVDGPEAWVQVFGLAREQRTASPAIGADHYLGGVVAGLDGNVAQDTRAGFFLGASTGQLDVKFGSQDEDVDSAFGGLYLGYATGPWAVDLVVTGGWSTYDLNRTVANNTVPGGLETASADYDGYFIAPELAISHVTDVNGHDVIPSVRLGYAGTHLDGYTETGSAGAITVDDRDVQLLTGRFQVAVPVRIPPYADTVRFEPYFGVEGRTRLDNSGVDAVLLGQTISFDPGGEDTIGAVLAGFELTALVDDGISVFGRVEGAVESNNGRTIGGQAGLEITF